MIDVDRRIHEAVATVTLNRPDKRNALSFELVEALIHALGKLSKDETVRVIVLTGAGSVFSAGADLEALQRLQGASFNDNLRDSKHLASLFDAIDGSPKPVIAKVNGHAIAGGCGLAAVCDYSIAAAEAKLGFTEVRIGFVPAIVSVFVSRKLRETDLKDLFLSGRLITAEESVTMGLISRAVTKEALDSAVSELALDLVRSTSGEAISATKALLRSLRGLAHAEALDTAAQANAEARATADCLAGVRAFLERTDPPWARDFDQDA